MNMISHPRPHQQRLSEEAAEILGRADHVYLEAPTASGKTLALALIAERVGITHVIYTVHTLDLVRQTKNAIRAYRRAGLIGRKQKWRFITWQKYSSLARQGDPTLARKHFAIVDECHMGGVGRDTLPKRAYPAIKEHAAKVMWVSATPWQLDETMMGARKDHTAYLGYDEAYQDGLLNAAELVRVDCGFNLSLEIMDDPVRVRTLHGAQSRSIEVNGLTAESAFEKLDELVKGMEGRPLRTSDVPALTMYRYRLMAEIYMSKHFGEKAIFWLPSRQHARQAAEFINQLTGTEDFAVSILGTEEGGTETEVMERQLEEWSKPSGVIKIACVVYRLREGFDYPHLSLGFDCSWNPYNYRAAVQKMGRLIRREAGKPTSTYYYAVDPISIAAARNSRPFSKRFLNRLSDAYDGSDMSITAHALVDAADLQSELFGRKSDSACRPILEQFVFPGGKAALARTPIFNVLDSRGAIESSRIDMTDMFMPRAYERVAELVEAIEQGRMPMPLLDGYDPVGKALRPYLSPSHSSFRPDLRDRLIACGALVPSRDKTSAARARLEDLVRRIELGEKLLPGSPERKFLWKYYNPSNTVFRPDIRERLIAAGALRPKGEKRKVNRSKGDLTHRASACDD